MKINDVIKDRVAIVGIGQTEFAKNIGRTELRTGLEAILAALNDAGLKAQDVDGITLCNTQTQNPFEWSRNLGCKELKFWSVIADGGGIAPALVAQGAMAIASGQADVVVAFRSRNRGKASGGRPWAHRPPDVVGPFGYEIPVGLARPVDQAAFWARRHMHLHGTTSKQFGAVAVALRNHAVLNPNAVMRTPMTIEDYLNSRYIAEPLRLFDNCLETDGAAAVVLTSAERARDLKRKPIFIMSGMQVAGTQPNSLNYWYKPGELESHTKYFAERLFAAAGVKPKDVDVAGLYDAFTPLVIMQLEDYGFCKRGEGGPFAESGAIQGPNGAIPVNTSGGSLSEVYLHGMNLIIEVVRQLRGESTCQVKNAEIGLATGAPITPTSAVILRR